MKKLILIVTILFLGSLPAFAKHGGSGGGSGSGNTEVRLRTRLTGNAIGNLVPSGHADFRERAGRFVRFSAEVEDVNLAIDSELDVFVSPNSVCSGTLLGSLILGPAPFREGDLNLDTRDGETVPQMTAGSIVSVCLNGSPVVSGQLAPKK